MSALQKIIDAAKDISKENPTEFAHVSLAHINALKRIADRGHIVKTIIDVGASDGSWSLMAKNIFPEARYHLIEANQHWQPKLSALCSYDTKFSFTQAAAGPKDGKAYFPDTSSDPYGGRAFESAASNLYEVNQVCIDSEIKRLNLQPPFLIKLDTHGFEREILSGAQQAIKSTSVLVAETYNFEEESRRFPAMCTFIENLGMRCVDIGEPLWRDYDKAFWQIDLFFVQSFSKEFQYGHYK